MITGTGMIPGIIVIMIIRVMMILSDSDSEAFKLLDSDDHGIMISGHESRSHGIATAAAAYYSTVYPASSLASSDSESARDASDRHGTKGSTVRRRSLELTHWQAGSPSLGWQPAAAESVTRDPGRAGEPARAGRDSVSDSDRRLKWHVRVMARPRHSGCGTEDSCRRPWQSRTPGPGRRRPSRWTVARDRDSGPAQPRQPQQPLGRPARGPCS
jgi:hypothetical protein